MTLLTDTQVGQGNHMWLPDSSLLPRATNWLIYLLLQKRAEPGTEAPLKCTTHLLQSLHLGPFCLPLGLWLKKSCVTTLRLLMFVVLRVINRFADLWSFSAKELWWPSACSLCCHFTTLCCPLRLGFYHAKFPLFPVNCFLCLKIITVSVYAIFYYNLSNETTMYDKKNKKNSTNTILWLQLLICIAF